MKRFFALLLCLALLVPSVSLADTEDYTVAGKLFKQLWAGSGFSGVLTLDITDKAGASTLQKPVTANVDYIYVRPAQSDPGQYRLDLTLMDGESATSAAHLQVREGVPAFQADVISPDWYSLAPVETDGASAFSQAAQGLLEATGVPGISRAALEMLAGLQTSDALTEALDSYTTRIDLWIEGFRQEAKLGKLADGTTTMEVSYQVPAQAVKAQAKQLVLDVLNDQPTLQALTQALGEETASILLNPTLQSYYFQAIDNLPLSGQLALSRTVSLKNETLALHLSLPLYDEQGGAVTLSYDRSRGEGDLPDDNVISLESDLRKLTLSFQEYSSMTDVRVVRGTLRSEPKGAQPFTVDDGAAKQTLALAFTLRQQESESVDEQQQDVYTYDAILNLSRDGEGEDLVAVPEMEMTLSSRFVSKALKSAATEVSASLTLGGDGLDNAITLTLEGKSRKKWEPEQLPDDMVYVNEMTQEDLAALLPGAAARFAALAGQYAAAPAQETETSPQPETTPEA